MNSPQTVGWPTDFVKNKGIEFNDVPNIFRNNTVESSIPNYFENKEPPIICYKYSKPIRSTIKYSISINMLIQRLQIHEK